MHKTNLFIIFSIYNKHFKKSFFRCKINNYNYYNIQRKLNREKYFPKYYNKYLFKNQSVISII